MMSVEQSGRVVRCGIWAWGLVAALGLAACSDSSRASVSPPASTKSVTTTQPAQPADIARAIQTVVSAPDATLRNLSPAERKEIETLYTAQAYEPLWLDAAARPTADAQDALSLLSDAATEGLDPAAYSAPDLQQLAASLADGPSAAPADLAAFDVRLSLNTIRYLRHLHTGRVNPRTLGFRIAGRADEHDFAMVVRTAVAAHRLRATADEFVPPLTLYRNLRGQLAKYRTLAADATLVPPPGAPASVHPGEPYAGLPALHRLLVALGDLPADAPASESRYDGANVEGVKRFQLRHGLAPDGVLGRGTQAALAVPMRTRVRQIELALERLRWLPHIGDGPLVAVNIPMFRMWTWESVPKSAVPTLGMGVIVGRALDTETPVFIEEMRSVIFRPYWNVPASILKGEILPAMAKDPTYLDRQNMEIVSGQTDAATVVPLSPESLARLARGELRVRQRPGDGNALGLVKFSFPNDESVYMHGTPAPQLFGRARRDFSHGCIRLEDPVAMAEWVLKDQPSWTRDRILEAMHGTETFTVNLSRPVQVVLFYMTVVVMPDDGSVRFAEDIYHHDAALERALARQ